MAKQKTLKQPETIAVEYLLHELPTAQHKAGLAGLILQIRSMIERKAAGLLPSDTEIPEIVEISASTATIRFSAPSTQAIFDDIYSAEIVEARSTTRWAGATLKEERPNPSAKEGEPKKWFIYDVVEPVGPFLRRYTDDGKERWHKLWRDMLWAIPRGRPTTRTPFNARAEGQSTKEGIDAWKDLLANEKAKEGGRFRTVELAGAIMIGAQAVNAETVAFEDRADHALLLHFWSLVARIFVPERVDSDGKREFAGYVLAFPDVSNLPAFCRAYVRALADLKSDVHGYRPAESVISIPEQGALEFMRHLEALTTQKLIDDTPARYIAGVEFFSMIRVGQNVKLAANGRIPPDDALLFRYSGIRAAFRNPVFLAGYLSALLRGRPWFAEFETRFTTLDWSFFLHSTQEKHRTPPTMIGFAWEANRAFQTIIATLESMKGADMAISSDRADTVDRLVYQLIGRYVSLRTLARLRIDPDDPKQPWKRDVKDNEGKLSKRETPEYQEERRKVCSTLFLELRSRNEDDFVQHFTATVGSVTQRWPLTDEDHFAAIAAALMRTHTHEVGENRPRTRDDVKTLALLALSAHSRSFMARSETDPDQDSAKENNG
ncbi:type I-MYXAN CRISPR-associated protein Cmx8 [Singulisphaera rosea]